MCVCTCRGQPPNSNLNSTCELCLTPESPSALSEEREGGEVAQSAGGGGGAEKRTRAEAGETGWPHELPQMQSFLRPDFQVAWRWMRAQLEGGGALSWQEGNHDKHLCDLALGRANVPEQKVAALQSLGGK